MLCCMVDRAVMRCYKYLAYVVEASRIDILDRGAIPRASTIDTEVMLDRRSESAVNKSSLLYL